MPPPVLVRMHSMLNAVAIFGVVGSLILLAVWIAASLGLNPNRLTD